MGRTILTEEQKELIALIPKAIRNSKDFTNAAKLVLAQLDLQDGTDFSETNHYVFSSNEDLMKNTGIASKHTVINAIKKLVNEGLIETKRGYRRKGDIKASEYILTDKYYELDGRENPHKQGCNKGCNKGCNCTNSINTVIEDMQQQINELREEIEKLQNALKKINCTSDTETDIDTDIKNTQCTIVHVTEDKNENTMNDMKYNDEFITENDRDAWEVLSMDDDFDYTQYSDIAEMVKRDAGSSKCNENKNKSMYDERNAWITRLFERLDSTLNLLSQCYDKSLVAGKDGYGDTLKRLFQSGDSKVEAGWFTEKQLYKYQGYINRYNGLMRDRRDRFNVKDTMTASNENSIISTGLSESVEGGGCAAPRFTNEEYLNALKKVFIEEEGWTLHKFYAKSGFGLYDYMKRVADILGVNVDRIDGYKFEKDIKAILPNDMVVEEPMVAYGNSSVKEAQQQFAMALAANG